MTTPKSLEQIEQELIQLGNSCHWDFSHKDLEDFLRSSMASLLCYMAERMPAPGSFFTNSEYCSDCEHIFKRQEEEYQKKCIATIIEEARKITDGV